jgi:hypothetical protein
VITPTRHVVEIIRFSLKAVRLQSPTHLFRGPNPEGAKRVLEFLAVEGLRGHNEFKSSMLWMGDHCFHLMATTVALAEKKPRSVVGARDGPKPAANGFAASA